MIQSNISNVRYSIFYYVHDDDTLKLYTYYSCQVFKFFMLY